MNNTISNAMTFDLTENEMHAAMVLVEVCFDGMGGKRPADLERCEYTWVELRDLTNKGWSQHSASGTFSSLFEKGILEEIEPYLTKAECRKAKIRWHPKSDYPHLSRRYNMMLSTAAWQWLDTQWDAYHLKRVREALTADTQQY